MLAGGERGTLANCRAKYLSKYRQLQGPAGAKSCREGMQFAFADLLSFKTSGNANFNHIYTSVFEYYCEFKHSVNQIKHIYRPNVPLS